MRSLGSRGETIVEVLMVIVILGSALTTSFVITGKATATNRTSLERTEADSFGQTQLERVKSKLVNATSSELSTMHSTSVAFCINDTNAVVPVTDTINGGCTARNRYSSFTRYNTNSFTTEVKWDGPDGLTKNRLQILYKAYANTERLRELAVRFSDV